MALLKIVLLCQWEPISERRAILTQEVAARGTAAPRSAPTFAHKTALFIGVGTPNRRMRNLHENPLAYSSNSFGKNRLADSHQAQTLSLLKTAVNPKPVEFAFQKISP